MRDAHHKNHRGQDKNKNTELPIPMALHANFSRFIISVSLATTTCNYTYDAFAAIKVRI
jgi:hypothetical protein